MKTAIRIRLRLEELETRVVPTSYSTNWAGYAVTAGAGAVTQVIGNWVVPAVTTTVSGYSSAWVGIDGYNSNSVEQIGTDSDYVNGRTQYYAWYEMYPNPSVNLSLAINPGDKISASVTFSSPNQFALVITNVTRGTSNSTTQTSSSAQRSSAEWIQEAPSSFFGVLPLANFGTINFSGADATVSGTKGAIDSPTPGATVNQINMVTNTGSPKATTSGLTDSGNPATSSFNVTWVSSGSGGGHGHHKAPDAPLPTTAPTITVPSVATPAVATSTPLPVAAPAPGTAVPVATPVVTTLPASSTVTASAAPFGSDAGDAAGLFDGLRLPEAAVPSGRAVAVSRHAPAPTGPAVLQVDPMQTTAPETQREMGQAVAAAIAEAGALSLGDHDGHGIALAGLLLTLAFDDRWLRTAHVQSERRRRASVNV
jgi:hypothetical protein